MLGVEEARLYCKFRGVLEKGLSMLATILNSEYVRAVKSNSFSTTGSFASHKNGCTIQFDSLHVELAYLLLAEMSAGVLLFRCQPFKFKIRSPDKNGVLRTIEYVPDFFVISENFIGFIQCKPSDAKMIELSQKHPDRYKLVGEEWKYPAVDEVLEGTGLGHKYFIRDRVKTTLVDNASHVADFIKPRTPAVDDGVQQKILNAVKDERIITIKDLLDHHKRSS